MRLRRFLYSPAEHGPPGLAHQAPRRQAGRWWQLERSRAVDYRLEVVRVPVDDMDRAKGFYQGLGWRMDFDSRHEDGTRTVQLTPPGSACSVFFSTGIAPGQDLVVDDIDAARDELSRRGAEVSGVYHMDGARRVPGPAPGRKSFGSYVSFNDPEGNRWVVQEVSTRIPGRTTSVLAAYGSVGALADALRRAAAAHDMHAKDIGHDEPDWPDWYARYLAAESAGPDMNA
jgi:catechol 2,3-dioxygenase-like lactoylglutathione lyase family enzyme